MNRNPILIQEGETPDILVNGDKYELFCEFESKDRVFQNIFVQESGTDVLVEIGKEKAIVGLFSTEENKVKQLFDYIEASISPNNGLICYESESFPRLLNLAIQSGGRFPLIEKEINPQTFISGFLNKFHSHRSLNKAMLDKIQEHMVPVERSYIQFSELDTDDSPYYEPDCCFNPTLKLPEGWVWKDWADGSGHLESPDGQCFFSYDCSVCNLPYNSEGIEYKRTAADHYELYTGTLSEFKNHAESIVNNRFLEKKPGLNEQIQSANNRAMVVQNSLEAKAINIEHEI